MAFVGAEAFAVCAVPRAHDVVFADGEDEVAFLGESDSERVSRLERLLK